MAAAGADPAIVQDALFDAEEHLQAEMAMGSAVERGTATYETRFAAAVEGYGSPQEVAAAYLGTAPAHEVVAAYETVLANGAAAPVEAPATIADSPVIVAESVAVEPVKGEPLGAAPAATEPATEAQPVIPGRPAAEPATPLRFCTTCGQELRPGAVFCTGCGTAIAVAARAATSGDTTTVRPGAVPAGAAPSGAAPVAPIAPRPAPAGPTPAARAGVQAGIAASAAGAGAPPSALRQIFGVFVDPAVYKALVYMIL
jgi:hypothetical protein